MSTHSIDKLAVAIARGGTRRGFLASIGAAIGLTIAARIQVEAGEDCAADGDCPAGMYCSQSFCLFLTCTAAGAACQPDLLCCDEQHYCVDGVCAAGPRCRLLNESCGAGSDCCPGMVCSSGICGMAAEAPPENTGGSGDTGGGSGDGGGSAGGNGSSGGLGAGGGAAPQATGDGAGATSGGVVVAALPSTGTGVQRETRWGLAAASLAGAAGLLGIRRRGQSIERGPRTDD